MPAEGLRLWLPQSGNLSTLLRRGRTFVRRHGPPLLIAWLLASLLLVLGGGTREPLADEATPVLMSESLWRDGDLLYRQEDLERALRRWPDGPRGLRLTRLAGSDGELVYAPSPVYPLLALPGFALAERAGMVLVNGGLFALLALLAWRHASGGGAVRRWGLAGFLLLSAATAHVLLPQPQVLTMLSLFAAAHLWLTARREAGSRRWGMVGGLLALAGAVQPQVALVGAAVGLDLALDRRWRSLGAVLVAAAVTLGTVVGVTAWLSGRWWPGGAEERIFEEEFPLDPASGGRTFDELGRNAVVDSPAPQRLLLESWYFLVGRQGGLLPLYPFAVVALVASSAGRGRARPLLAVALTGVCALAVWGRAAAAPASEGVLGSPLLAACYPVFLLLAPGLVASRWLLLPGLAAGFWTVPALACWTTADSALELARHASLPTFQLLPAELNRFAAARRFGMATVEDGRAVWVLPAGCLTGELEGRIRLRGDGSCEAWVVSPEPRRRLRLTARSPAEDGVLVLSSAGRRVTVRFDSPGKRAGTPLELELRPQARDLGNFFDREHYYRLSLFTEGGALRRGAGGEARYRGVTLTFGSDYVARPPSQWEVHGPAASPPQR